MLNQSIPHFLGQVAPLSLRKSVRLEGVYFSFESEHPDILRGVNLEIKSGECIGLIGSTGSGKSTMVDVKMGLLKPTSGQVLLDDADLHDPLHPKRLAAWQASIAHVPQSIYLADCSIAENIAFGIPPHKIDMNQVQIAAKKAQISSFIESNPGGYSSVVGEQGIRLSGGQRQRIGIARALYKQARVLVLDEATSALDTENERSVIQALEMLDSNLTIIMIAHRLSTLAYCDYIYRLEQGSILLEDKSQIMRDSGLQA